VNYSLYSIYWTRTEIKIPGLVCERDSGPVIWCILYHIARLLWLYLYVFTQFEPVGLKRCRTIKYCLIIFKLWFKQDRRFTYNVILRRVGITIIAVEVQ